MKQNEILYIDIESTDCEEKTKKDNSGTYYLQTGYAHIPNRDGTPARYPQEFTFYRGSKEAAYPTGTYVVDPASFQINYNQLQMGFMQLKRASFDKSKAA